MNLAAYPLDVDVISQANAKGWRAGLWPPAEDKNVYFTNSSIVRKNSEILVAQRRIFDKSGRGNLDWRNNRNDIVISRLAESPMNLGVQKAVVWPDKPEYVSFEDPRLFVSPASNELELWCCVWGCSGQHVKMNQTILEIEEGTDWYLVKNAVIPSFGNNNGISAEKNWCPIEGTSLFVYQTSTEHVVFDRITGETFSSPGLRWPYGDIRGGTPAIRLDDIYVSLMHSSVDVDKGIIDCDYFYPRRYFAGAYAFSATPPFEILRYTKAPILWGSYSGPATLGSPAVIFPCGAVLSSSRNSCIISFGVNDCASGWINMPIADLLDSMSNSISRS